MVDLSAIDLADASKALLRVLGFDLATHTVEAVRTPVEGLRVFGPGHLCVRFMSWEELEEPGFDGKWQAALKHVQAENKGRNRPNRRARRAATAEAVKALKRARKGGKLEIHPA